MSVSLALGPIVWLRTKVLYAKINQCVSFVALSDESKSELDFWQNNVKKLNGPPIWFESGATCSDSDYSVEVGPQITQVHGQPMKPNLA